MGGGIFYGLKIWQGTALGCPEPLIQEIVKNHHHETVLPYHGHEEVLSSYPGYSSYGSGFDLSNVYSNTPTSYSGPSYLPPSGGAAGHSDSYASAPPSASDASGAYRRKSSTGRQLDDEPSSTGRQISDESTAIFGDLIFRFLGVNTDQCRRRFVCELQFRNPFLEYAVKYMG